MDTDLEGLIRRADAADPNAVASLFTMLYHELHRLAEHTLRHASGPITLGPTTLLHEAYLNIVGRQELAFTERGRFLAYAARAMRGLVLDYARRQRAWKRGPLIHITLDESSQPASDGSLTSEELAALADAMDQLAELEPAHAELVDLHFFCGFSFIEIAALRGVSERTVQRDWRTARLVLHHTILGRGGEGTS